MTKTQINQASLRQDDIETLQVIALRFRAALQELGGNWELYIDENNDVSLKLKKRLRIFKSFPWNCCGKASALLTRHLYEQGFQDAQCVAGTFDWDSRQRTHQWVEVGNVLIDITADQFEPKPSPPPVTVAVTAEQSLYQPQAEHERLMYTPGWQSWCDYDEEARELMDELYGQVILILSRIPSSQDYRSQ